MEKGLLSFCVLCYNHGKFVTKTLESIWKMELPNIEIIIVDDGSKDTSVRAINELKEKSPCPCTLIAQKNTGNIGHNFNVAISKANGELITFIAADDFYEPVEFKKSFGIISSNKNCQFVASTKVCEVNSEGECTNEEVEPLEVDKLENPSVKDLLELDWRVLGSFYIQGCIFRKELVDAVHGFDEDIIGDDIVLRTKVFKYMIENNIDSFYLNHNPCVFYRRHGNNVSKNTIRQMLIVSEYLEKYWPERENPDCFYGWLRFAINRHCTQELLELFSKNLRMANCLSEKKVQEWLCQKIFEEKLRKKPVIWLFYRILRKIRGLL